MCVCVCVCVCVLCVVLTKAEVLSHPDDLVLLSFFN